ncbi:M50 family metallopeptidase [Haloferula rosea]|uniref:M50 family metallopeptidase n=1 Tax=Haloferula rosea TaxID=490093 RepID=A0A934RB58_9BACT|nr:M50 family metallopeptidase [Haloferula rosea]MBK1825396.1 M50 family metallopeptidase [Haloferula rosea]
MTDDRRILTAYHEAGHAVMALLMGRTIQKVSIIPSQNRLGSCTIQKGRAKQVQDKLEADMLILLAGMAAEGKKSGRYNVQGAGQDLQAVERLAMARSGNSRQAAKLLHKMLDKTQHLLADNANWAGVKVIANELMEHESISGRAAKHHLTLAKNQSS